MAAGLLGCQQLEERIDSVSSRVDNLENTQIASLKQQLAAMDESVGKLEKTDTELKGYIETLQGTADALRKSISDNDAKISELEKSLDRAIRDAQNSDSALKSELEQQIASAKTDVLSQLASAKTAMESRLAQIESTITSLQTKDSELEKKIADLKTSMDAQLSGEISSAKDWVTATFATLEQYNSIVSDISGIRSSIATLESSLKSLEESLTGRIRTEVADAIAPIKDQMVSEAAAEVVAGYTEAISSVRSEVEEISSRVKALEDEVKLIKEDVDNIKTGLEEINSKLDSGQPGGIQSIVFVPEYSDGKARAYYSTEEDGSFTPGKMTLRFAIVPADMAAKIAGSWKSSLSLEATYTRTKAVAAGDDVSIPILEASASDGKLTVTASAETLDESFFKKELSASVRLVVNLDGIGKSSEYVPATPTLSKSEGLEKKDYIERPATLKTNADYKYIDHRGTTYKTKQNVRNYEACYDTRRHNPMWVAYPCHAIWWEGGYTRPVKDPWRPDLEMAESEQSIIYASDWENWPWSANDGKASDLYQYWSPMPTNKTVSKGHLMRSAERGCGDKNNPIDLNVQAFYPTNIAPECYQNATSETSHWEMVENILPNSWRCSDTLYVVVGCVYDDESWTLNDACNWSTTSSKSKSCVMPTARYKLVLRTKSGSTGKAVWECSADELMAIGFWFPQNFTGEKLTELPPLADYIYSVSDIEKKIGGEFSFFPLAPQEVKESCRIDDWPGLSAMAK